jgi:AraC-like DNA-binding protein
VKRCPKGSSWNKGARMKTLLAKDWLKKPNFPFQIDRHSFNIKYGIHKHEFLEFVYVSQGCFPHNFNGTEYMASKGDVILLNPSHKHSLMPGENAQGIQCIFMPAFLGVDSEKACITKELAELVYLEPFFETGYQRLRVSGIFETKIRMLLFEMLYEYEKKPKGYEIALKTKLLDFLMTLVRVYEAGKVENPSRKSLSPLAQALSDCLTYINMHFKEPLTLEEISQNIAGITKEYFCAVFKKMTGRTFVEYVTHLRIEEAKKLLSKGPLSITKVCYGSGFNDMSHFIRTFKASTGLTPSNYRRKLG